MSKVLFIFGFGYVAEFFANKVRDNFKIYGTSRTERKHDFAHILNYDELNILPSDITHILFSIPPSDIGDPAFVKYQAQLLKLPNLKRVVYLSSTGVYEDSKGNWVDESSTEFANNRFARARLLAEQQMQTLGHQTCILRLAGIYGPTRNQVTQLQNNSLKLIDKPDQIFSRIHVEDIAHAIDLALTANLISPYSIFNIADDYPSSPLEVAKYASEISGIALPEMPPYDPENLSELGRIFYSQSKRIKNDKAKSILGWKLKYPSYREGLINCEFSFNNE